MAGQIQAGLNRATVVLAIIGPRWLTSDDAYGRRRLDNRSDWVRLELQMAIEKQTPIVPVLVGEDVRVPPPKALPRSLRPLVERQGHQLRDDPGNWPADLRHLGDALHEFGLTEQGITPDVLPYPSVKKSRLRALTDEDLGKALEGMRGWEPWEDSLAREHPAARQELRKNFVFATFQQSIEFMSFMAPRFDTLNHHPRWGNEWKIVTVRLTTWDAGNKITDWDIRTGREVDQGYSEFVAKC